MTEINNNQNLLKNFKEHENFLLDSIKVLSDLTQKDINRSYDMKNMKADDASNSNLYGWFFKRVIG